MPLVISLQVDSDQQVVVQCAGKLLAPPTALASLPRITPQSNPFEQVAQPLGQQLFNALGGNQLLQQLDATAERTLHLVCDEASAAIPWEYAYTGSTFLGCDYGFLRLIPGTPAPPAPVSDGSLKLEIDSLDSLEKGAGQILQLVTALLGLIFGVLAFSSETVPTILNSSLATVCATLAPFGWLVALVAALVVVLPGELYLRRHDLEQMNQTYQTLLARKSTCLNVAIVGFGGGMIFFIGLTGLLLWSR